MSESWAAALPGASVPLLGPLRLAEGIEVCPCPRAETVWLRGDDLESFDARLRALPGALRFRRLPDDQLIAVGHRVPTAVLPAGDWVPLRHWLSCSLPPSVWPGATPPPVTLRLVRASIESEPNLLLLSLSDWREYVTAAPQIRLDRLSFALDGAGRVLVRGLPLPPLKGQRFVEFQGIAVPIGWHWQPAVDPATLRALLGLDLADAGHRQSMGDLALITSADGAWERVSAQAFVQATRSAVRLSAEAADERT